MSEKKRPRDEPSFSKDDPSQNPAPVAPPLNESWLKKLAEDTERLQASDNSLRLRLALAVHGRVCSGLEKFSITDLKLTKKDADMIIAWALEHLARQFSLSMDSVNYGLERFRKSSQNDSEKPGLELSSSKDDPCQQLAIVNENDSQKPGLELSSSKDNPCQQLAIVDEVWKKNLTEDLKRFRILHNSVRLVAALGRHGMESEGLRELCIEDMMLTPENAQQIIFWAIIHNVRHLPLSLESVEYGLGMFRQYYEKSRKDLAAAQAQPASASLTSAGQHVTAFTPDPEMASRLAQWNVTDPFDSMADHLLCVSATASLD